MKTAERAGVQQFEAKHGEVAKKIRWHSRERRNAGIQAGTKQFSAASVLGRKRGRLLALESPVFRAFQDVT